MKIVHWFDIVLFVRRHVRLSEIRWTITGRKPRTPKKP